MKKIVALSILCLLLFAGCGSNQGDHKDSPAQEDIIEIKEKMFVQQTNEIYLNLEDYLGGTFKYEGFVDSFYSKEDKKTYYAVIRYGPGCCGTDANCGFEVEWDGKMPKNKTWVEVVGVLKWYDENKSAVSLKLSSLQVLKKRGAETVSQ